MKISSTALFSIVMIVTSVSALGIPVVSFNIARARVGSKVLKSLAIKTDIAGNIATQFYVPMNKRWNIQAIYIQIMCDSSSGNRYPYYEIVTSDGLTMPRKSSTAFIAGSTGSLTWVKNAEALAEAIIVSDVNSQTGWLPNVDLEGSGAYVIVALVAGTSGDICNCIVYGEEEDVP